MNYEEVLVSNWWSLGRFERPMQIKVSLTTISVHIQIYSVRKSSVSLLANENCTLTTHFDL